MDTSIPASGRAPAALILVLVVLKSMSTILILVKLLTYAPTDEPPIAHEATEMRWVTSQDANHGGAPQLSGDLVPSPVATVHTEDSARSRDTSCGRGRPSDSRRVS